MPEIVRAAAYCRDSGGKDQDLSIDQQVERISQFCRENNLALTRVFKDEARSGGRTAGREQFLDMMKYMEAAPEEALVIWSYSRFSRDYDDSQYYLALLRSFGKKIISIADPIPDTLDGRIMESLVGWQNAKFRENLAKDVRRGMRFAIASHKAVVGKVPKGYQVEPVQVGIRRDGAPHTVNRLVIDPATAPLVQLAWQLRAEGRSYAEIHTQVKLFPAVQNYSSFFRSRIYLGVMEWDGGQYENYAPALIDSVTWERVQQLNHENEERIASRHPRRQHSSFLLSGLIYCKRCGKLLSGMSAQGKRGGRYTYYSCIGKSYMDVQCNLTRIRADTLDRMVLERLQTLFHDPAGLQEFYEQARESRSQERSKRQSQTSKLSKEIGDLERKIGRLVAAIESAGHSQALIQQLGKLEEDKDEARRKLANLETYKPAPAIPEIEDLEAFGQAAWEALVKADFRKKQLLLRELIAVVRVDRENGTPVGEIELKGMPELGEISVILPL